MTYTRLKRGLGNDSHISIVVRVGVENKVQYNLSLEVKEKGRKQRWSWS
jgi:hypothetical protein